MDEALASGLSTRVSVVAQLVQAGNTDTVYRDIYFDRARELFEKLLTPAEYLRVKSSKIDMDNLLRQISSALDGQHWAKVKDLTGRVRVLRQIVDEKSDVLELAQRIYEPVDVPFNPFDRRMQPILEFSNKQPAESRDLVLSILGTLGKSDRKMQRFYAQRKTYFEALRLAPIGLRSSHIVITDPALAQKQARIALEKKDIGALDRLAEEMLKPRLFNPAEALATVEGTIMGEDVSDAEPSSNFAERTLSEASRLGLIPERVEPSRELHDYLQCCCAAHAKIPDRPLTEVGKCIEGCTCGHPCPPNTAEPLKETLDLLILHPFIDATGVRYLPRFGTELVLFEDFPEDGKPTLRAPLLDALALPRRAGLSRIQIDHALLQRGPQIIRSDLGLDPLEFRLACIPFDLYSRLAETRGWGQQKFWTHFDGYQIWKGGRLRALVGGDVRFGGRYDLCSISRADEHEGVVARFAVIRRERLQVDG